MSTTLLRYIDRFPKLRVLVIGEAMLDVYLMGVTRRLSQEAPVPIVDITRRQDAPGGAANTAVNVRSLGGEVAFLSVIGQDIEGSILLRNLTECGVSTEHVVTDPERRTLAKHRVISSSHMLVRFDHGSTEPASPDVEQTFIRRLTRLFPQTDAVVISDYGYGVLTPGVIQALADLQARHPQVIVLDSKQAPNFARVGVTAFKPNYGEAIRLLNLTKCDEMCARVDQISSQGERILDMTGARIAAVTMDSDGALLFERGALPYRTYAQPARQSHTAGAGDTFASALALALAVGAPTPEAAEIASAAAAIVVEKGGTAACTARELREHFSTQSKVFLSLDALATRIQMYREQGKRVVFTNGCFDILHRGHITYLNRAKALGDILVVGVNTDDGVRRLKGPDRPINSLEDRMEVLSALSAVDHLIAFNENTPHNLIRVVRPDVFVKGGDYVLERLPEASLVHRLGGTVQILPYVEDHSTTAIIHRIRSNGNGLVKEGIKEGVHDW